MAKVTDIMPYIARREREKAAERASRPPAHPSCRSSTSSVFGMDFAELTPEMQRMLFFGRADAPTKFEGLGDPASPFLDPRTNGLKDQFNGGHLGLPLWRMFGWTSMDIDKFRFPSSAELCEKYFKKDEHSACPDTSVQVESPHKPTAPPQERKAKMDMNARSITALEATTGDKIRYRAKGQWHARQVLSVKREGTKVILEMHDEATDTDEVVKFGASDWMLLTSR
jgi:hypothetical protein